MRTIPLYRDCSVKRFCSQVDVGGAEMDQEREQEFFTRIHELKPVKLIYGPGFNSTPVAEFARPLTQHLFKSILRRTSTRAYRHGAWNRLPSYVVKCFWRKQGLVQQLTSILSLLVWPMSPPGGEVSRERATSFSIHSNSLVGSAPVQSLVAMAWSRRI